jgi:branched-chain amino acid transport system ATP-binding protein
MSAVFEVINLRKAFGGLAVTNDVSLSMAPGDRVALIGPNGAGKTTFVNLVTGNLHPDSGEVRLGGETVNDEDRRNGRVKRGLVRSFQVTRLFQEMTPAEHVALPSCSGRDAPGACSEISCHARCHDREVERICWDQARPGELMHRKVSEIAYGQQRLLEIAVALALRAESAAARRARGRCAAKRYGRIEQALADLPADLAVLMIEHDMDLVFRFAKRVIVLAAGAIIFDGSPPTSPRMRARARGLSRELCQ